MDIGPISAIRPVIKLSPVAPDLSRVFEVEYLGQPAEDEYTPARRKASRGLEDEEESSDLETSAADNLQFPPASGKVSLFA